MKRRYHQCGLERFDTSQTSPLRTFFHGTADSIALTFGVLLVALLLALAASHAASLGPVAEHPLSAFPITVHLHGTRSSDFEFSETLPLLVVGVG